MTTPQQPFITESTYYIGTVCQSRTQLLDRLALTLERLGQASLQLKTWLEFGDSYREIALRNEIARLRGECFSIRSDLQAHRARHGC